MSYWSFPSDWAAQNLSVCVSQLQVLRRFLFLEVFLWNHEVEPVGREHLKSKLKTEGLRNMKVKAAK